MCGSQDKAVKRQYTFNKIRPARALKDKSENLWPWVLWSPSHCWL